MLEGVYQGKLANKYPIRLFIQRVHDDGSLQMYYWYQKYKTPIELSGRYVKGKLNLYAQEYNKTKEKWIKTETFIGMLKNNLFIGRWKNLRNGHVSDFNLQVND